MHKKDKVLLLIATAYTLGIIYLTFGNPDEVMPDHYIYYQDKYLHLIAYIVLSILWGFYFLKKSKKNSILMSFFLTLILGIGLEFTQEHINPLRQFDYLDMLANCLGVVIGTIIAFYYKNLKLK